VPPGSLEEFLKKWLWIAPVLLVLFVYSLCLDNFFVYDDFIWLYRAKTLGDNFFQALAVDVVYFDPLVYVMFWLDSLIAGLNPFWYHAEDLVLHCLNACLVYRIARLVSGREDVGAYSALFFGCSFAIADAVIWPSSRVDLISVLFSLATLIAFQRWLQESEKPQLLKATLCFALALGAKGTPVVLPAVLSFMLFEHDRNFRRLRGVLPFVAVTGAYLVLLKICSGLAGNHATGFFFNPKNLALAVSELMIPERFLVGADAYWTGASVAAVTVGMLVIGKWSRLQRLGLVLLLAGLAPVLVIRDFKLVAKGPDAINLLSSPSHRIYLAFVGLALVFGGLMHQVHQRVSLRPPIALTAIALAMAALVAIDFNEVRHRDAIWEYAGTGTRVALEGVVRNRTKIADGGLVGLVQFPGSDGFMTPMFRVFLDLPLVTTVQLMSIEQGLRSEFLVTPEKNALFVLGITGDNLLVYDFSDQFRRVLYAARNAARYPDNRQMVEQSVLLANFLNRDVMDSIKR